MWVKGAQKWYRHMSVWGILLLGVLPFLDMHGVALVAMLPDEYKPFVSMAIAVVVAVLRFIKQTRLSQEVEDAE